MICPVQIARDLTAMERAMKSYFLLLQRRKDHKGIETLPVLSVLGQAKLREGLAIGLTSGQISGHTPVMRCGCPIYPSAGFNECVFSSEVRSAR